MMCDAELKVWEEIEALPRWDDGDEGNLKKAVAALACLAGTPAGEMQVGIYLEYNGKEYRKGFPIQPFERVVDRYYNVRQEFERLLLALWATAGRLAAETSQQNKGE